MFIAIDNQEDYDRKIRENPAVLAYFSTPECNVCRVLKPKIREMMENDFPECKLIYIDSQSAPELAAQNRIFTVPTLVVYFDGREFFRKSRNFGLDELRREMQRPYGLLFS